MFGAGNHLKSFCGRKPVSGRFAPDAQAARTSRRKRCSFPTPSSFFRLDLTPELRKTSGPWGLSCSRTWKNDIGYEYTLLPGRNRVQFEGTPNLPWYQCLNTGLERPVELAPGKEYRVTIIADGDVCVFYLNGTALSSVCRHKTGKTSCFTAAAAGGHQGSCCFRAC